MGLNDNYWKGESSITSNRRLLYMDVNFIYFYFFLILLILIVGCLPCICANFLKARVNDAEREEEEEEEEEEEGGDEESSSAYNLEWNTVMNEHVSNQVLFLTKFRFQTVLPDKSNVNARTIRSTGKNLSKLDNNNDADKDTTESTAADEEEEDDDFQITTTTTTNNNSNNSSSERSKLDLFSYYNNFNSSWGSSSGGSKLDLFSSFSSLRKAVHQNEECCFCLEGYEPGQTICAAASKECNHVFHEECMKNWFYEKKSCPICRTDFLKSSI